MVGCVGHLQFGERKRKHPRDVDRDVAGADDDDLRGRAIDLQAVVVGIDLQAVVVGMAVVPGNELGKRRATRADPRQ